MAAPPSAESRTRICAVLSERYKRCVGDAMVTAATTADPSAVKARCGRLFVELKALCGEVLPELAGAQVRADGGTGAGAAPR